MDWNAIRGGRYGHGDAERLIANVLDAWPATFDPLAQLLVLPVPSYLDCFIAGVMQRARERGLLSDQQAQVVAMACLRLIVAKRKSQKEEICFVAETLNAVAAQVPDLLARVSGVVDPRAESARLEELSELERDLTAHARGLDFTNVAGEGRLLDRVVTPKVTKQTEGGLEVMALGDMTWRGLAPWAYEPVADAFIRVVTGSSLDRDSQLVSFTRELGYILSTLGGFNSIPGRSPKNVNDVAIGATTLQMQIEELLAARAR